MQTSLKNLDLHGKQNSKHEAGEVLENIILPVILGGRQSFEKAQNPKIDSRRLECLVQWLEETGLVSLSG